MSQVPGEHHRWICGVGQGRVQKSGGGGGGDQMAWPQQLNGAVCPI